MRNFYLFCKFLLIVFTINKANAQQIDNLRIKTLEHKVNLFYSITNEKSGQLFDVQIKCSNDEGITFNVPIKSLSGDIGKNIEGGEEKIIIWDALQDIKDLKGNYTFKIIAEPSIIENQSDHVEDFYFELVDTYKKDQRVICALKITNNGTKRDLKIINRLAKIYDSKGKRIEANSAKLGRIQGNSRHSTPTLSFLPNTTQLAFISFPIPNGFSKRIKMFELGVEVLEITYGLDLKTGNIQFKDISLENPGNPAKAELISENIKFNIGKETRSIKDSEPPIIKFTKPNLSKGQITKVNNEELLIEGIVTDKNGVFEITVNGMYAQLDENGIFKADAYLVEGNNTIFLRAVDNFQNVIEEQYSINYEILNKKDQRQTSNKVTNPSLIDAKETRKGKYYALIIGVSTYPDPEIMDLDQPFSDATKLYNTLTTNYTFDKQNAKLLNSPTREQIISELDRLNRLITDNDNLLIFYAGHGYWDSQDEVGYWMPSDAKRSNTANWIRNSTIRDYLRTVKTKHTLLIADACFSGGIFKTRKAFTDAPKSIQKLYEYPSRKAMTSGSLKEVPDKSVFLLYLDKRLNDNIQAFISAEELFGSFKIAVLNNSPNVPQYGEIKDTGDEGGDFIFIKK
jgi:hypothetical protein